MIIPSYSFIFIFLPIVIIGYFLLNRFKLYTLGKTLLLASSALFYYLMGWKGFLVLLASIIVCYLIATFGINEQSSPLLRKIMMISGIFANAILLLYCKYLGYFEELINHYSGSSLSFEAFIVPVGISYFTFSQISYIVDSYYNPSVKYSFLDYSLFVSFFPKITVGPIAFASEFIPAFNDISKKSPDYTNLSKGFIRITLGMSKKLIIADNLAAFVDLCYLNISALGSTNAALAILAYTLQIYFDFSGYCDIAIGICQMLNLDLIDNFDAPYRAVSISDFWKRWHISLTRFFRNYIYIPLGGNRRGKIRMYINTMIIFLISGLWHGAATTFILWGALHGVGSIISKLIAPITKKLPSAIRWFVTFIFINLSWVLFRSPDIETVRLIFAQLFSGRFIPIDINIIAASIPTEGQLIQWIVLNYFPTMTYYSGCAIMLILIILALLLCTVFKTCSEQVRDYKPTRIRIILTVVLFVWSILSLSQVSEFIYVNF